MSNVEENVDTLDLINARVLNNLVIGVYKGINGHITEFNSALKKILGYNLDEDLDKIDLKQFCLYPEELKKYFKKLRKNGFVRNLKICLQDINGRIKIILLNSSVIGEKGKKPIEHQGIIIETNNFFETVLNNTDALIAYLDLELKFIWVNEAYANADEREADFFPGKNHFDLYPNPENEKIFQSVVDTGEPFKVKAKAFEYSEHPERGITYWDWSLVPIKDSNQNVISLVLTLYEATERIKAEQDLKKSEEKYRKAFNLSNFYKDLIAHDMNNIMQTISSSIDIYQLSKKEENLLELKGLKLEDIFTKIKMSVFNGSKLISNVSKLSLLKENDIPLKKINVNKILETTISSFEAIYQNLDVITQGFEKNYFIRANSLLKELFENIILNSIQHNTNPTKKIKIRLSETELEDKNYCKMEFIDNGKGISDKRKDSIFSRKKNYERNSKGMGIGLSLVKRLTESYDGKIWVENRVKEDYTKGSNFILLIPKID